MKLNAINNNQQSFGMAVRLGPQMRRTIDNLTRIQQVEGMNDFLSYLHNEMSNFDFDVFRRGRIFKGVKIGILTKEVKDRTGQIIQYPEGRGFVLTSVNEISRFPKDVVGRIGKSITRQEFGINNRPARIFDKFKAYINQSFADTPIIEQTRNSTKRPGGQRIFR